MAVNPRFYPEDFSSAASAQISSTDLAIEGLRTDQTKTAIKSVHSRRMAFQAIIDQQNERISVIPDYLPLPFIGQARETQINETPIAVQENLLPSLVGSIGFFFNDLPNEISVDEISFRSETIRLSGVVLSVPRARTHTFGSNANAYICAGTNVLTEVEVLKRLREVQQKDNRRAQVREGRRRNWRTTDVLPSRVVTWDDEDKRTIRRFVANTEELSFFTRIVSEVGELVEGRTNATGHASDVAGYSVGGWAVQRVVRQQIEKMPFSTRIFSVLGNTLDRELVNSQGADSATAAYWAGGRNAASTDASLAINLVEKMPFSTENPVDLGDTLDFARRAGTAVSNGKRIAFAGGMDPAKAYLNSIEILNTDTDTLTVSGEVLSVAKINQGSCGSNFRAYFAGGRGTTTGAGLSVEAYSYESDSLTLLGDQLTQDRNFGNDSSISDFSPSFVS